MIQLLQIIGQRPSMFHISSSSTQIKPAGPKDLRYPELKCTHNLMCWRPELSAREALLSVERHAHLSIVEPRAHKLEKVTTFTSNHRRSHILTCPSLHTPTVSVHQQSLIPARISHASSAQIKDQFAILKHSTYLNGLKVSAAVGFVERRT